MPNMKPVSDFRNYTEALNVSDKYSAAYSLLSHLKKAEERALVEGWIDEDDLDELIRA